MAAAGSRAEHLWSIRRRDACKDTWGVPAVIHYQCGELSKSTNNVGGPWCCITAMDLIEHDRFTRWSVEAPMRDSQDDRWGTAPANQQSADKSISRHGSGK